MEDLESRLTWSEFREWANYEAAEPFGAVRDDWRAAYMLAVIANMVKGKNQKSFNPMDFAPTSVQDWFRVIQEAGRNREDLSRPAQGSQVSVPVHPTVTIFEEMYRDHVNYRRT